MRDEEKTNEQLINELQQLRHDLRAAEVALVQDRDEFQQETAALKQELHMYTQAFHANPDLTVITTLGEGRYIEISDSFLQVSGYKREEVVGRTARDMDIWVSLSDRDFVLEKLKETGFSGRDLEVHFRYRTGEIGTFIASTELISIGGEPHLLWVIKDITERKKMQEALRLSEDKFAKAFYASPITMSITTLDDGRITAVNDGFCRALGYSREEILGKTSMEIGFWPSPWYRSMLKSKFANNESVREMEIIFGRKGGENRLGLYSAEAIEIEGQPCVLSILVDITERKQSEEVIKYLSFHDKLTGLYNRAFFEEELARVDTERQLPISLIMGDVNGLKLINDALGHSEGDQLLVTVAKILRGSCRREDLVARWGGDEFLIMLPRCGPNEAAIIVDRIKQAAGEVDYLPIQLSISLGVATKQEMDRDIIDIIREAEDRMYRNKLLEDRSTRSAFLTSLERTLWTRSHETEEHCQRMQQMTLKLGRLINLPDSELDNLKLLAALHDIGKIAIPNSILDKPGKLTADEWETIKKHPEIGYRIALSSPEMAPIAQAILHHHERWDGTGYPLGIKGAEIPLLSRILAIADAYDAMTNGRPYQSPIAHGEAWSEIERCAGTQFDPDLVGQALEMHRLAKRGQLFASK